MDPETERLLISVGATLVAGFGGIVLGHWLGRRAERSAALRDFEILAIEDTREQFLNMFNLLEAVLRRDPAAASAGLERLRTKVYPRARAELIADPALVEVIASTVPAAYEQLPHIAPAAVEEIAEAGHLVREAMRKQELRVRSGNRPLVSSQGQRDAMEAGIDRINAVLARNQSWWRQVWLGLRIQAGI